MMRSARNGRRKLKNNTYLYQRENGSFQVVLHETAVITIYQDGTYQFNSGGWRTRTTQSRINEYSPVKVYSRNGTWMMFRGTATEGFLYQDGTVVDSEGHVMI